MDPSELNALLESAAEKGARRALESVGLHDEHAGKDIHDLRTLIDGWRTTKRAIADAIIKWLTVGILGFITIGAWWKLGGKQ